MSRTWYSADLHFDHRLVAEERGYASTEEHDAAIIAAWNSVVQPSDVVWFLGDVSISGSPARWGEQVDALNGHIHLIAGNHDACHPMHRGSHRALARYLEHFESVQPFARRRVDGFEVLLSHFPYAGDRTGPDRYEGYRLRDRAVPIVHGHTHSSGPLTRSTLDTIQLHVGWDAWHAPVAEAAVAYVLRRFSTLPR